MAKRGRKRIELTERDPGWYVREWLVFKGIRQIDLVNRSDGQYNKSQVNEWVNGAERWNKDVLYAFAHAIGVEPADLLRPPPASEAEDEFSKFVVKLDQAQKARLLRLWDAATDAKRDAG